MAQKVSMPDDLTTLLFLSDALVNSPSHYKNILKNLDKFEISPTLKQSKQTLEAAFGEMFPKQAETLDDKIDRLWRCVDILKAANTTAAARAAETLTYTLERRGGKRST